MICGWRGYQFIAKVWCRRLMKEEWVCHMTSRALSRTSSATIWPQFSHLRPHILQQKIKLTPGKSIVTAAGSKLRGTTTGPLGNVGRLGDGSVFTAHGWCSQTRWVHNAASDAIAASVDMSGDGKLLHIKHKGQQSSFHGVWLRHNCHCSQCKQVHSGQRLFHPHQLLPAYTIDSASLEGEEVLVGCKEEPNHVIRIPLHFLQQADYSPKCRKQQSAARNPVFLNESNFPKITYAEVSTSRAGLHRWLQALNIYGICLVSDVPAEDGMVRKVAEKIWPIQQTIYGEVFEVKSTPNPINVAYSDVALCPHTDLMYYESAPGLQFLHCIRFDTCVEGGDNVFLDSFYIAEELRQKFPTDFATLTRVPATFQKIHYEREHPVHMRYQRPHIAVSPDGLITSVNWSPPFEGPLCVKEEDVEPYYQAYHRFATLLENTTAKVERKLKPGDLISFNNRRILHARKGFKLNGGVRFLQGCYLNIDEFKNQVQVLSHTEGDGSEARRVGNHCWL